MKMNEPLGNAIYGPMLIRLALGAYFVLAGLKKLHNQAQFIAEVQKFGILPAQLSTLYAVLLPYLEIGAGALLLIGIWTTLAALVTSALLASFIYALGLFPNSSDLFNKDVILLAASMSLLYSGAGGWSIDRFRKTG